MLLQGGVSNDLIPNYDPKGNIYYTDQYGNRVEDKQPLIDALAKKLKAFAINAERRINRPTEEESKRDTNTIIALSTLPLGAGATATKAIATRLTPYVGRQVAKTMAQGIGAGAVGGGVEGIGRGLVEGENPILTGLTGALGGATFGGLGGLGAGKIGQKLAFNNLYKNGGESAFRNYFDNYIEGLNNPTKAMADFRAARTGVKPGLSEKLFDNSFNKEIEDLARDYFGTTTNRREAGYILNDGSFLDMSGKKFGGPTGRRTLDHREIVDAFLDNPKNTNNLEIGFDEFIDNGAVRYMPETNSFFMSRTPTDEQISSIKNLLNYERGKSSFELVPNVKDWGLDNNFRRDYKLWSDPNKIIDDIRIYFNGGKPSELKDYY